MVCYGWCGKDEVYGVIVVVGVDICAEGYVFFVFWMVRCLGVVSIGVDS